MIYRFAFDHLLTRTDPERARRIARPVENRVAQAGAAHFASDCPMAAAHIAHGLDNGTDPDHPLSLLRRAYGI